MNILKISDPRKKEVEINRELWFFPYKVYELIELEDKIIVNFNFIHMKENPQAQYKEGLSDILWKERAKLRSGDRALNKNKREWAEEQK